jgi:hypothetical protein
MYALVLTLSLNHDKLSVSKMRNGESVKTITLQLNIKSLWIVEGESHYLYITNRVKPVGNHLYTALSIKESFLLAVRRNRRSQERIVMERRETQLLIGSSRFQSVAGLRDYRRE